MSQPLPSADTRTDSAPKTLEVRDLSVGYGRPLLEPVSGSVHRGELLLVMGANGAGKSTLLRTVLGLQPALGGHIGWAPGVIRAFVRQRHELGIGPERVIDAVRSGLTTRGTWWQPGYVRRHRETVERCLTDCGLDALRRQQVATLSEGQKQRVMLARALASGATVLVLDEPTAAMDATNEAQTFELLVRLQRSRDLTLIVVSHRVEVVGPLAQRALFMDRRRGTADVGVARWGPTPDIWATPEVANVYPIAVTLRAQGTPDGS